MTLGHEDLMRRASRLFDRLILAIAVGHHKRTMFTIAERLEIAQEIATPYKNVEVTAFRGLLRDFVVEAGGKVVVRGLRAVSDFEYEFQMAGMIGGFDSQLAHEFFQGFANHALVTLHIDNLKGDNAHHQCETVFKAFARALRMALAPDPRSAGVIPSTKGSL